MIKWSEWPLAGTGEVWCNMRVILKQKRERKSILETQRRSDELCLLESGKGFHKSWYLSKHWRRGQRKKRIVVTFLHACMLSCFSHDQFFATLWTVAHQAPLSMGFSRQESGLPCPPPGDLAVSYVSCIGRRVLYHSVTWEAHLLHSEPLIRHQAYHNLE